MKCPFNCDNEDDIPEFDNDVAHLIITLSPRGHAHIHMPFEQEALLKSMVDTLLNEMKKKGIDYMPPLSV